MFHDRDATVRADPDGAVVDAVFPADLFDADTIDRMLGHYRTLLEAAVRDPDQPVTTLPMLTRREWQDITEWNDTGRPFPADSCLHELVESHAEQGDVPAVICGQRVLSRAELEASANRLAHRLRELGAGPETLVGVCLQRSPERFVWHTFHDGRAERPTGPCCS